MSERWRAGAAIALVAAGFVAVRAALLVAAPLPLVNHEERYTGVVAEAILSGPVYPLWDYQYESYGAGSMVVGMSAIPAFAALGPRFVALKVTAVSWSLVSCLIWLALFARLFGRRVAVAAAVFWVFAPFHHLRLSLMAWGNHAESTLFTGLALLLLTPPGALTPRRWRVFAAGIVSGFAVYFCYSAAAGSIAVGAGAVLTAGWLGAGVFAAGAVVGLAPWVAYNATHSFAGLRIHGWEIGDLMLPPGAFELARRSKRLVAEVAASLSPPTELGITPIVGYSLLAVALLGATQAVVGGRGRHRSRPPIGVVLLVMPALFALFYVVCDLQPWGDRSSIYAFRFLSPLLPSLALGFGLVAGRSPRARWLLALPVVLGLAAVAATARGGASDRPPGWLDYRGYSYGSVALRQSLGAPGPVEPRLERAAAIVDPSGRRQVIDALVSAEVKARLGPGESDWREVAAVEGWIASLPPEARGLAQLALVRELERRAAKDRLEDAPADRQGPIEVLVIQQLARQRRSPWWGYGPDSAARWLLRRKAGDTAWRAYGRWAENHNLVHSLAFSFFGPNFVAVCEGAGEGARELPLAELSAACRDGYRRGALRRYETIAREDPARYADLVAAFDAGTDPQRYR